MALCGIQGSPEAESLEPTKGEHGVGGWGRAWTVQHRHAESKGAEGWRGMCMGLLRWFAVLLQSIKHLCSYTLIYTLDGFLKFMDMECLGHRGCTFEGSDPGYHITPWKGLH